MNKFNENNETSNETTSPVDMVDVKFCGQLSFEVKMVEREYQIRPYNTVNRYAHGAKALLNVKGKLKFTLQGEKQEMEVDSKLEVPQCDRLMYCEERYESFTETQLNAAKERVWLNLDRLSRKDLIELMKPKFIAGIFNFLQKRNAEDIEKQYSQPFDFNFTFETEAHKIDPKATKIELD